MAPPIDNRLGPGTLTLDAVEYGAQLANVLLEPSQDSEDGTPTLGDPDPLPEITESWVLTGEAIQDWSAAAGFVNFCMDNALTVVPFVWTPNEDVGMRWEGDVLITSVPIGGDVSAQNRSSFEFAVQGTPTRTTFVPSAPAGDAKEARELRARRAKRTTSSVRETGPATAKGRAKPARVDT